MLLLRQGRAALLHHAPCLSLSRNWVVLLLSDATSDATSVQHVAGNVAGKGFQGPRFVLGWCMGFQGPRFVLGWCMCPGWGSALYNMSAAGATSKTTGLFQLGVCLAHVCKR